MNTKELRGFRLVELMVVIAIIGLLAVLALPAKADVGSNSFGITNSIAANATVTSAANVGTAVKVDKQDNCSFVFVGTGDHTDTGNVTITFARSADNSVWETAPQFTWTFALTSTTQVVQWLNNAQSVIGAAGYVKVVNIINTNANSVITNATLTIVRKTIKLGN